MYAGVFFAVIGVAVWLGTCQLFGYGMAILSLIGLLIARTIWLVLRARQANAPPNPPQIRLFSSSTDSIR